MAVRVSLLGQLKDGSEVHRYSLINKNGTEASFVDLGAIWTNFRFKDKQGQERDLVLSCDELPALLKNPGHMGAVVGRNANRIGGAGFTLSGVSYSLAANDKEKNNLHSGPNFWERRLFDAEYGMDEDGDYVIFSYHSESMEQGFPGNVDFSVSYVLSPDDSLHIRYHAFSDEDTIMNPTQHAYFNLNGCDSGDAMSQTVQILADYYTPADYCSIPYGVIEPVEGTPMDFRKEKPIGRDIAKDFEPLNFAGGYDHNFCINGNAGEMRLAAVAHSEKSGIELRVYTELEGMQFYTGNYLSVKGEGKNGSSYAPRSGYCFETQHYPDAINKPNFPSPVLSAGEEYKSETIYSFSLRDES